MEMPTSLAFEGTEKTSTGEEPCNLRPCGELREKENMGEIEAAMSHLPRNFPQKTNMTMENHPF